MRPRHSFGLITALVVGIALAGCDSPAEPTSLESSSAPLLGVGPGVVATATGGGVFDAGIPVNFAFSAVQRNEAGDASGNMRFAAEFQGMNVEFHGRVTCMTSDLENRRAWVGAVITRNLSTHPAFTQELHQPGRDIWFRVVDYGEGAGAEQPDRTTFVGFEGGADIPTSAEYCEARIWPDGDARTGPVLEGNIKVNG